MPSIPNARYVLILREKRILFQSDIDVNKFDYIISNAAKKFRIHPALIKAIIKAESNFNHEAISPVGAQGLMQLMPATAYALQVEDVFHPENNIEGGARYLRYLLNTYRGNLTYLATSFKLYFLPLTMPAKALSPNITITSPLTGKHKIISSAF